MALSVIVIPGDGVTTQFNIPFALGYIKEGDITCRVGTEVDGTNAPLYRTLTFLSPENVEVSGLPAGVGVPVRFERTVDREQLIIDYEDGSIINEDNMNTAQKQALMLVQEVLDGRFSQFQNTINMGGYTITNVGTPVDPSDVATKDYVDVRLVSNAALVAEAIVARDAAIDAQLGAQAAQGATVVTRDEAIAARDVTLDAMETVLGIVASDGVLLESIPGFDPNNAHIAAAAVAELYNGASSITLRFLPKTYTFKASTVFNVQNVRMVGEAGNKLVVTNDVPAEAGAFEFGTQVALEPTGTARQAITANIAIGARSCVVANAGAFARGDVAGIVSGSGSSSGEYWYGVSGQNGFERARKCEMLEIERVDIPSNTVYFMAPTLDSYDCTTHAVQLRKFNLQGDSFESFGVNWYGPGGASTHDPVSTPSSGPRAINVWGFRRCSYNGGSVRNFPRFFGMFYNCMFGGSITDVDVDGWDSKDVSNFRPMEPLFRSVWFTAFFICGGMNWVVHGNKYRNMRRLCDIDRGPWFTRNVIFSNNVADNCEYVMSGHVGDKIEYSNNIGIRCRFGMMTRARNTKAIGNMIQCERYGMQAGPIAGSGIIWDATTAQAGSLEFIDNTVEVSDGEYFATYLSFSQLVISGNTCFGSKNMTLPGLDIQAVTMRNLIIEDNSIELPAGSTGNCIDIKDNFSVLQVQDGVFIDNNALRGGAQGIRFRGVAKGIGTPVAERTRNVFIGSGNRFVGHSLRDIRFEQGAYDAETITVNTGQTSGPRGAWPRVSLGSDIRRWTQLPLSDTAPVERPDGTMIGFVNTPTDNTGGQITGTTMRQGQKYWNVINPGTGQPSFILVGQDGTRGTLVGTGSISVTGSMANGSTTLTVNDALNIAVGCFLTVAGAGFALGYARVVSVTGNVVVLNAPATAAVSNAAVAYRNSSLLSAAVPA